MMQILLIDDDILTLNQLQGFLGSIDFVQVIGQLSDGLSAMDYITAHARDIDVIILDMEMPGANGPEVAKLILEKKFNITILGLSNYDNFEYVKPLFKMGAFDYLLKHELTFSVLLKKLTEINNHRIQHTIEKTQEARFSLLSRQRCLHDLVLGYEPSEEDSCFMSSDSCFTNPHYILACMQVMNYSVIYQNDYSNRHKNLIDTVLQFSTTFFSSINRGLITYINNGEFVILFSNIKIKSESTMHQTALHDLQLLKYNLQKYLSINTIIEYLPVYDTVASLSNYYNQIHTILQKKPFTKQQVTTPDCTTALTLLQERELLDSLIHQNPEKSKRILTSIFTSVKSTSLTVENINELLDKLISILQRSIPDTERNILLPADTQIDILDVDKLQAYFIDYYNSIIEYLASVSLQSYPPTIRKAIQFIRENYSEDISLSSISNYCGVSEVYFSKYFKNVLGISFTKYLTQYRIDAASALLRDSDFSLKEIALNCGFQNYNYFLTVFKNYTGKTPLQYRSTLDSISH